MINIVCSSRYQISRHLIKNKVISLLNTTAYENNTINIVFVGKNKMRQLCQKYKKEDLALPVLSFPYHETVNKKENFLGEVVLCYPQVVLLAAERNKKVDNMILKLVQHGLNTIFTN